MVLNGHMPDLDSLEVFVAIAQTGSLGGAARVLGLTQQAVSRRLAALEAKTGVTLAIRTTRGSQITPAGTSLAEWASHLLEVAPDIDPALGSLRNEGTERLTVVARIELAAANSAQATALVRDGAADLGFVETPGPPEGLSHCVVSTDELVVVVSPNHEWARQSRAIRAQELAHTSLVCREPRAGIRDSLHVALRRVLGVEVQQAPPVLELPSAGPVRAAVLAGAAPAARSRLAGADDLAVGRLREVAVTQIDLRRDLRAIWLGGSAQPHGAIKSLLTHIGRCTEEFKRDTSRSRVSSGPHRGSDGPDSCVETVGR